MKCSGINVFTGEAVEVTGEVAITAVEPVLNPPNNLPLLAPGFIDLQVNGFAGVDYCAAGASIEEIGRSVRVQFSTGVTRLFPTVITGTQEVMEGAMRRLAEARETLPEGAAMDGFHAEGPHISPE